VPVEWTGGGSGLIGIYQQRSIGRRRAAEREKPRRDRSIAVISVTRSLASDVVASEIRAVRTNNQGRPRCRGTITKRAPAGRT